MQSESVETGVVESRDYEILPVSLLVGERSREEILRLRSLLQESDHDLNSYEAGHVVASIFGTMRNVQHYREYAEYALSHDEEPYFTNDMSNKLQFLPGQGISWYGGDAAELFAELVAECQRIRATAY